MHVPDSIPWPGFLGKYSETVGTVTEWVCCLGSLLVSSPKLPTEKIVREKTSQEGE